MSDEKINCTRLPDESFSIRASYFCSKDSEVISRFVAAANSIAESLENVLLECKPFEGEDIMIEKEIAEMKQNPVQINLLLFNTERAENLGAFTYTCNNTFHNMPNILIANCNQQEAEEWVKKHPCFDLFVYNEDYDTLLALIRAIRERTYDDQPIPLNIYNNLARKR